MITWFLPAAAALAVLTSSCHGANILVLAPMPTRSHYNLFDKLSIQLARRGHEVTLIAPFKQDKPVPNLNEVLIENLYDKLIESIVGNDTKKSASLMDKQMGPWKSMVFLPQMGDFVAEKLLESDAMKKFLKVERRFDLVISENFLFESAWAGLAYKYRAPTVIIAPFTANYWANYMVGNPSPTSYIPDPILGMKSPMNFFERTTNTVYSYLQEIYYTVVHLFRQELIFRRHFGSRLPLLSHIVRNTSLVLVNHHHVLHHPRPYVPNMIEIGGYHVEPPKPLPQDLKNYMDRSKHGVILFALGSHVKSADMTPEMINGILAAFAKLKQNILWKFESDNLKNLPGNVKIMKWLPQTDVLAHPNLKLFITHGGLLSTIEAVTHAVPLVGIPLFGDQPTNMRYCTDAGFAVTVPLAELNGERLYESVQQILTDPRYAESAKRISNILKDQPMKPMDTAIYWIEYVIRHKGARHLRSSAQDLQAYELYLLDVLALVLGSLLLLMKIVEKITKFICGKIYSSSNKRKTVRSVSSSSKKKK